MEQLFTLENLLKLSLLTLTVVGILLLAEGEHPAQMQLFFEHITSMSKSSFYFVMTVLVFTDLVQTHHVKQPWPQILPPKNQS